jgi:transposase
MAFCKKYIENEDSIVCIDEACFYVGDKGKYGYCQKGKRLNIEMSRTLRRKKYTLIMAISKNQIIHYKILSSNCNLKAYKSFVEELQLPSGTTLLMDNVQFHKSKEMNNVYASKGFKVLFVPPYSPKMNAIENVFSYLKREYRSMCPVQVQDNFDYVGAFESVLAKLSAFNKFYSRVKKHVLDAVVQNGEMFCGYD